MRAIAFTAASSMWPLLIAAWLAVTFVALMLASRPLRALWREPVMRHPVLIVESDDWGPGPALHAERLRAIARVLQRHRDPAGRPAVMTLAVVLARPEPSDTHYRPAFLDAPRFAETYQAIREGAQAGVFALQLHGMEHYGPASLMRAAAAQPEVRAWLRDADAVTEDLPSPLQSRWTDASELPSRPLPAAEIASMVAAEVEKYTALFDAPPRVVVPPTFVWNATVEGCWAAAGVEVVVTPGWRNEFRDAQGKPVPLPERILNGDRGIGGVQYVVRDDYFEPALAGHDAARALAALHRKTWLGRPTLLETHRFNFIGDVQVAERALTELDRLLGSALRSFAALRFVSTAELAQSWRTRDPKWVDTRYSARLLYWLRRAHAVPRLRKLAWASGMVAPGWLLHELLALHVRPPAAGNVARTTPL